MFAIVCVNIEHVTDIPQTSALIREQTQLLCVLGAK